MLGSKKSGRGGYGATTLISRETRVMGDIHFAGNLDVEGVVEGNIYVDGDQDAFLRIVEQGCVRGDIHAPSVVINGTVEGDVYATQSLELAAKARVQGNVNYALVEMAVGAEVNGALKHIDEGALSAEVAEDAAQNEVVAPIKRAESTGSKS